MPTNLGQYSNPSQLPGGQQIQTFGSPSGLGYDGSGINPNSGGGQGVWNYAGAAGGQGGDVNQAGANSDPFAYTNGSLLTPWTRTFQAPAGQPASSGGGGGGPAPSAAPGFNFAYGGFSPRDVGDFNLGSAFSNPNAQPFNGGQQQAPTTFSGSRQSSMPQFTSGMGVFNPGQVNLGAFNAQTPAFQQDRFTMPDAFKAPEMTDDTGYKFRLQQGQDALMNNAAAKGLLRNGGTMSALMDYNQNAASQEYGAAYGRARNDYDTRNNLALAGYDRNAAANLAENQTAWDRETGAYDRNIANQLAGYDRNTDAGFRQNETAYGRAASEYDRTNQNQMVVNEANYGRSFNEDAANQQRQMAANDSNYARHASEYDRNFSQARDVYQMNTGNQLAAYQANAQNAQAMGNLEMQASFGTYDRNYQNYATGFNVDEQRRQQAAAQAAAGAAGSRADEQQAYNRAMTQYNMEYGQYRDSQNDQFSRLYALAGLGQGAAASVGNYAGQYGQAAGGYMTGAGNAMAAGQVGAANAWQGGFQGAGSAALQAAGMYLGSQGGQGYTYPLR